MPFLTLYQNQSRLLENTNCWQSIPFDRESVLWHRDLRCALDLAFSWSKKAQMLFSQVYFVKHFSFIASRLDFSKHKTRLFYACKKPRWLFLLEKNVDQSFSADARMCVHSTFEFEKLQNMFCIHFKIKFDRYYINYIKSDWFLMIFMDFIR